MFASLNPFKVGIDAPLADVIALARRHGFAGVDFDIVEAVRLASDRGVEHVNGLFDSNGVRASVWESPVDHRGDQAQWQAGVAALHEQAELSIALDCQRVISSIRPGSNELPYDENFASHLDRFGPIAEELATHGIRLGLEFIGPASLRREFRYPFIHRLDQALEFAAALGTDNVGILFDSYHWYLSGGTLADFDRLTNDQIVHVHLNDAVAGVAKDEQLDLVRNLPGETGMIDLAGFLSGLRRIGYDGPFAVEPFNARVDAMPADETARVVMASLRQIGAVPTLG